ncbi:hypothetical protein ACFSJ3_01170 [Corallincola platygyrae]|uniref:Uncharacterized protein n=1 Tax=Corallincola platygyrae TaxID=1193278 RepID=A0ABW4XGF4_9GAMM
MNNQDFNQWHNEVISIASEDYGMSGEELDALASHIFEHQYQAEHLSPEQAAEQILSGYPPIS